MADINLTCISPSQLDGGEAQFDMARFPRRYLAQGDSWFSLGHFPFWATTNLLLQMTLSRSTVAVNCARPGVQLAHMTDTTSAPVFLQLLNGAKAWDWNALLVSGGGNDLIDAVNVAPAEPQNLRLLLLPDELGPQPDAARFVSAAGWQTFESHMDIVLAELLAQRDAGINRGIPLVLHTYDYVTPRDAPAGLHGLGPWLLPALQAYAVPEAEWNAVADVLIDQLADMWLRLASRHAGRNVNVVDTRGSTTRAEPGSTGVSHDWENEIHPTPRGYTLLAARWRAMLDAAP